MKGDLKMSPAPSRNGKRIGRHCPAYMKIFFGFVVLVLGMEVPCLSQALPTQQAQFNSPRLNQVRARSQLKRLSVTIGYTYLYASQGTYYINLNGWFAKPALTIGKGWSAFADFTNYYGENKKGSLNSHGFTFGGQKGFFPKSKVRPSLFAEAGDVRVSSLTVTNSFIANFGGNVQIPFANHFSLAITPAEYVMIKPSGDAIRNDFNAKVGLAIHF
jgi:hypothetical protein